MEKDWFAENAPKEQPALAGDDWFAKNAPVDFSGGPDNTEGKYSMGDRNGKIFQVAHSKVPDAYKSGLVMPPDESAKYVKNSGGKGARFTRNFLGAIGGAVAGTFDAVLNEAKTPDEIGIVNGFPGDPIKARAALIAYRMGVRPAIEQGQQAASEFKQSAPTSLHPTPEQLHHRQLALGHGLAAAIPGVGPWAAQVGEEAGAQAGQGDVAGGLGTLGGNAALYVAPEVVKGAGHVGGIFVPRSLGDLFGTEPVRDLVEKTLKDNENARTKAAADDKANFDEYKKQQHETKGKELKHKMDEEEANRVAHEKADTDNAKERDKVNKENLEQITKEGKERLDVLQKNKDNIKDYEKEVKKAKAENNTKLRLEKARQKIESDYKAGSIRLRDKYNAAFKKAKQQYNEVWNIWRDMVKNETVDMAPVTSAIKAQEDTMTPQQVAEFRDILRQTEPDEADLSDEERDRNSIAKNLGYTKPYRDLSPTDKANIDKYATSAGIGPIPAGSAVADVSASRLHGWKSQLEVAVRSSKGVTKHAVGQVLDVVRKLETDVSSRVPGAARQLGQARALTGPYFDAFFKSPEDMPRALAQSLREQTPGEVKTKAQDDRLDRIAAYDPSIKSLANHVDNLETGLKNLPKPPKEFVDLPAKPTPIPKPKPEPLQEFKPKEAPHIELPKPERSGPDKPPDPVVPEIATPGWEEMQKVKDEALKKGAKWVRYRGRWIATSAMVGTTLYEGLKGNLSAAGKGVLGGMIALLFSGKVADFLEREDVKAYLTKPNAKDVAEFMKLPADQRKALGDAWNPVIKAAEKEGVQVSPVLKRVLTGAAGSQRQTQESTPKDDAVPGPQSSVSKNPKELLERAKEMQDGFHRAGLAPAPQTSVPAAQAKPSWTHVFNPETGNIEAI